MLKASNHPNNPDVIPTKSGPMPQASNLLIKPRCHPDEVGTHAAGIYLINNPSLLCDLGIALRKVSYASMPMMHNIGNPIAPVSLRVA